MLPSAQRRVIEKAKFNDSPLLKALEKQTKIIEEQGRKQIDVITNQSKRSVIIKMMIKIIIKKYLKS